MYKFLPLAVTLKAIEPSTPGIIFLRQESAILEKCNILPKADSSICCSMLKIEFPALILLLLLLIVEAMDLSRSLFGDKSVVSRYTKQYLLAPVDDLESGVAIK